MRLLLTVLLQVAFVLCSTTSARSEPSAVRVLLAELRLALSDAAAASPSLRRLLTAIESSDVIVHVVAGHPPNGRAGVLRFVASAGGKRYLRIEISDTLSGRARIAVVAHELQHVVEVARAPEVRDPASYAALYDAIGVERACESARCYDTVDAQRMGQRVLQELSSRALGSW